MTTLALIAASGLAREVLAVPGVLDPYDDVVVVDDDPLRWGDRLAGHTIRPGGLPVVRNLDDARLLVCAGSGLARQAIVGRLAGLGVGRHRYASVLHPSVEVSAGSTVGRGSILLAQVTLTCDVTVGRHVVAMPGVTLTHDDVVEDFATLCAGVTLGGGVRVGEAAYVGMNAAAREGTVVGAGSTLGMGSVLLEDLPPGRTWAGVPAADITARHRIRREALEALS